MDVKINEKLIYPDESYSIRVASMEVYKTLGNGFLKATGFQLCLLFNFGHYPLIEIVRVANINDYKKS